MKNTIFYSWQSDLPNNSNRGFIESCIVKTIKEISKINPFSIELNLDRDTKNTIGTPDIADSIFNKISKSKIFIADISIINSDHKGRKCPNPNVLLELGYAVRVLGWEKVFCIYNADLGDYEDLPFDLKHRRPITYSLNESSKSNERKRIAKILTDSITDLNNNGSLFNEIDDYVKEKIDTEILTIINHLSKILFSYTDIPLLERINAFLNLTDDEITEKLKTNNVIGFQIFKKLGVQEKNLREITDKMISSVHQNKELAVPVIKLIKWIGRYDKINSTRSKYNFYTSLNSTNRNYNVVNSQSINSRNNDLPDRFILLRKITSDQSQVIDFGDYIERDRIENLLSEYKVNQNHLIQHVQLLRDFIQIVEQWLDLTNGEFILDTFKHFEIKQNKR